MATISERYSSDGSIYQVRIRRRGFKEACATFKRKTDAKAWICEVENAMRTGRYFERQEAKCHTLLEAMVRATAPISISSSS